MQLTLDAVDGRQRKQRGIRTVSKKNAEFLEAMRYYAQEHSRRHGEVTTDVLRLIADLIDLHPTHHNCWGAIFHGPRWVVIGRRPSAVPSNHGREIRVYRYTLTEGS
jgi:hypothetical protein